MRSPNICIDCGDPNSIKFYPKKCDNFVKISVGFFVGRLWENVTRVVYSFWVLPFFLNIKLDQINTKFPSLYRNNLSLKNLHSSTQTKATLRATRRGFSSYFKEVLNDWRHRSTPIAQVSHYYCLLVLFYFFIWRKEILQIPTPRDVIYRLGGLTTSIVRAPTTEQFSVEDFFSFDFPLIFLFIYLSLVCLLVGSARSRLSFWLSRFFFSVLFSCGIRGAS